VSSSSEILPKPMKWINNLLEVYGTIITPVTRVIVEKQLVCLQGFFHLFLVLCFAVS